MRGGAGGRVRFGAEWQPGRWLELSSAVRSPRHRIIRRTPITGRIPTGGARPCGTDTPGYAAATKARLNVTGRRDRHPTFKFSRDLFSDAALL